MDNRCLKYSILAKFGGTKAERVLKYNNMQHRYNFDGITFPTPLDDIKKFERNNHISINVFGLDKENNVYCLKVVDEELDDHRDLLLINKVEQQHYVYI